jgi:transglutaminase-like putative cysteine protease
MYYQIIHNTRLRYSQPVSESMMEVRMQPRTEANQRCLRFKLATNPSSRVLNYADHLGNIVHYFDVPARHAQLFIQAESLVEMNPPPPLPDALDANTWDALDAHVAAHDYFDYVTPSENAMPGDALRALAHDLNVVRRGDPLSLLREVNARIYESFEYDPNITEVDSPIDVALASRRGVCQDFSQIMIALLRELHIPVRYISGYLYYEKKTDRSTPDASHAWVEAMLPGIGWVGFDPTNNILAGERHIRVAVGRDYLDVPPNKGLFKGVAESTLTVDVKITREHIEQRIEDLLPVTSWTLDPVTPDDDRDAQQGQQQQ